MAVSVSTSNELYNQMEIIKNKNTPVPTAENLSTRIIYHDYKHEIKMLQGWCQARSKLFQLQNLVQAGELQYINQTLDDITNNLIHQFMNDNLGLYHFIQSCLTPIMYLLKRQQNLDDFFSSISFKYEGVAQSIENRFKQRLQISLRMLIHILFVNADQHLQRVLMSLLSQRNPVPLISPNIQQHHQTERYMYMPSIIHVWNFKKPTILSFGIGPCKGKSTLLNQLFQSNFEQTVDSIYFQQTIDVDFGYCFNPERQVNIADTHGFVEPSLLKQIHPLFDGFLIHVSQGYLQEYSQSLIEYLDVLPEDKFRMIIIRDTMSHELVTCSAAVDGLIKDSGSRSSVKSYVHTLVNISNTNDRNILFAIRKLREDLFSKLESNISALNTKFKILTNLPRLLPRDYVTFLETLSQIIDPLKTLLLERNNSQSSRHFQLYVKFQELCKVRQKLKKLDFYGSESEKMFEIYEKLHNLEKELEPKNKSPRATECGQVFELFIKILNAVNSLMALDLLATDLKRELTSIAGEKMAGELSMEHAFLSLEVLWRNAIVCYNHTTTDKQNLISKAYVNYMENGFPFEIVDGDNLNIQHQFLTQIMNNFASQRILVISIIGPQNSGKSTLLNYMFGSLFDVREGRCTRGIYGSFLRLNRLTRRSASNLNSEALSNLENIDYIMLIDTEGLLSIEKSDHEYDRRLVLFCLAVSHLVIVNMMGDVNETLKDMLTLCADSLKQIGVNKVNQPIVHFVLNQKADPNLKNHSEAIDKIIRDLKEKDVAQVIDVSPKTFHTLPSAFKKERVSNDPRSPCFIRTEPDFIQRTQQLCEKIIDSAKVSYNRANQTISDPPQWLRTAITVFDTLQKFPDLTYFKDINERRQDDRIRQHIGELISKTLPAEYRNKTIRDFCGFNENEIRRQLQAKFDVHQNDLDNDLKIIFKATNASERIRERCTQFLKRQVTEIRNAWCTAAVQAHDQKEMEVLVRDGSDDLRKLIDDLIKSGQVMTTQTAHEEFDKLWARKLESIDQSFNRRERLQQAIKFVYGNYNIFEKQCLPSHHHILQQIEFITDLAEQDNIEANIHSIKRHFSDTIHRKKHDVLEPRWEESRANITYTLATIDNFNYLRKDLLKDLYTAATIQLTNDRALTDHTYSDGHHSRRREHRGNTPVDLLRQGYRFIANHWNPRSKADMSVTESGRIDSIALQYDYLHHVNKTIEHEMYVSPNRKCNIVPISDLFQRILTEIIAILRGNDKKPRPIEVDLTQQIVGLINARMNEFNLELIVFKWALSKEVKSTIHTYIVILLTKYYYDEQQNHFHQQIQTLNKEKSSLLTYFISMVVPDAECDAEGAMVFATRVKNMIQSNFTRDANVIASRMIDRQTDLNRKQIQQVCDGKLHAAAGNNEWLFRYIDTPTDVIIEEFQILWAEVEKTINQELEREKMKRKNILCEFFNRMEFILSSLANEGSPVQYIDDIFAASGGIAADNLTNKGQCMVLLLYKYLSGERIQSTTSFIVFNEQYTLKSKGLRLFEKLPPPSESLAKLISGMESISNSNVNGSTFASIKNLHAFLRSILDVQIKVEQAYDDIPTIFSSYDKDHNYSKLLDKVRGCTSKCPCCQRPCDMDHTLVKSKAGISFNKETVLFCQKYV